MLYSYKHSYGHDGCLRSAKQLTRTELAITLPRLCTPKVRRALLHTPFGNPLTQRAVWPTEAAQARAGEVGVDQATAIAERLLGKKDVVLICLPKNASASPEQQQPPQEIPQSRRPDSCWWSEAPPAHIVQSLALPKLCYDLLLYVVLSAVHCLPMLSHRVQPRKTNCVEVLDCLIYKTGAYRTCTCSTGTVPL